MVAIGIKYLQVNSHRNCGAQSLHSENTHKQICRRSYAMNCGLDVMSLGSRIRLPMFKLPFCLLKDEFREWYILLCLNFFMGENISHFTCKMLYTVSVTIWELNKHSYYSSKLSQIKMKAYTKILNVQYVKKTMKVGLYSIKKKNRQQCWGKKILAK